MDSMRSLNTSLPTPYTSRPVPPEHLLQAFKSAALSVTSLYKSAVQDQNNSRAAGYQDALDDLLRFLDSENLGLQDGEGWRVRQWVTERYDGTANHPSYDNEEERLDVDTSTRHSPDLPTTEPEPVSEVHPEQSTEAMEHNSEAHEENNTIQIVHPPEPSGFHFQYPSDSAARLQAERDSFSAPPQSSPVSDVDSPPIPPNRSAATARGRLPRNTFRSNNSQKQLSRNVGSASGSKRKNPFPDINFFDIPNSGPRDGTDPGHKRSRMT